MFTSRQDMLGENSRALLPVAPLLGAGHEGAVDVLVSSQREYYASSLITTRLWSCERPSGSLCQLYEDVYVASPALALAQLAARTSLPRTIMLASELCGTFAIYEPPSVIKAMLQKIQARNEQKIPTVDGWSPFVSSDGTLSNLWSRPPLLETDELLTFADLLVHRPGCSRLKEAALLVKPGAASPLEVQTGVLLGLSRRRGGEGLSGFEYNKEVRLTQNAGLLAQRQRCYCDLYWEEGLDVECQSALVHQNEKSFLADSERATALKSMGINVLPVTYDQINDPKRFEAFVGAVARMLGIRLRQKTDAQRKASAALRREVFADWETIQRV